MATEKAACPILIPHLAPPSAPHNPVYVVFTDIAKTKAALRFAARLARGLDLRIVLLAARRVPFPLQLEFPQVSTEFTERLMTGLVSDLDADVSVRILLCRMPEETLMNELGRDSIVVMGAEKKWWPSTHRRMARLLSGDGRRLVLVG